MDESAVIKIVEANLERLMQAVGVPHWTITVNYGPCDSSPTAAGEVDLTAASYWRAAITINPYQHSEEKDVIDTLVHELLHVVIAPMELLAQTARQHVQSEAAEEALQVVNTHAVEQTVLALERGLARHLRNVPEAAMK